MDNPTTTISQNIINVDIDSRKVTLPVNFNLGVMYDNSCKTIIFMVQKKSDITDLTDLTFSVNTVSAKGTPDKIDCECREEGGFYIITALLKGTIFEASGKAVFNLCGQKFDSSHVAIKSWGSEDITALVGSHSHADKAIEERYPSVLEDLKNKIENLNITDEQLNSIATKVAEKGFYTKSEIDSMIADIVVPTRLSQLTDDTTHRLVSDTEKASWNNKSDFNGSYNSLTDKPTIPTRLSQLTEDDSHMTVTKDQRDKIDKNTSSISELKGDKVDKPSITDDGKIPRAKAGGVEWVEIPTEEQTENAVTNWLNAHPEATTTVQDGSITEEKFSSDTKLWNTQRLSIISNEYKNSGYSGELFNQFGAEINVFSDYIDTDSNRELFYRVYRNNIVGDGKVGIKIACYDADKGYLYTMSDISGDYSSKFTTLRNIMVNETLNEANVRAKSICRADIPDEVKFVRFAIQNNSDFVKAFYERLVISYEDLTDYDAVEKTVYNRKLITAVESITGLSRKPGQKSKTMVMIGDSLTNWGGGNDTKDGFLKIVHDNIGVVTTNEGLAGAWWQTGDGQTQCGVKRVDKIIADKRKYDIYCFMLGTNGGSTTDTGETSADTTTMCGAIRYCIEKMKAYDPTGIILVLLPPQRAEGNDNQEKVNAVIKSIVNSYGVKTLDIYHESGIVPNTKIANINYLSDGLHLNKNGYTVLGNILSSEIKYLLCL